MRKISTAQLRELEVINLCGGERLGYPCDFEIDLDCGAVISMTVKENEVFSILSKKEEYLIPWCKIECIGEDAILVKISATELSACQCGTKKGRKSKKCR